MRPFHLRVVRDRDGGPVGGGQALLRLVGYWISQAVFYLGFAWILIDSRRRGWADLLGWDLRRGDRAVAVEPDGAGIEARLGPGLVLPPGHRFVTLAEDPGLRGPMGDHNVVVWPDFMLEDPVAGRHWHHLFEAFASFQVCLIDGDGAVVAALNSAPIAWDGTEADLPSGWDDQLERSVADLVAGRTADTLGALQIVVSPARKGDGLSGLMVGAMRAIASARGYRALIACVRPTDKERYPTIPIDRYARWTRSDGLPFDAWIRLHVRVGGRIVRPAPRSMTITGSVAEWEGWTDMAFPESGEYVVPGAAALVTIDRAADSGGVPRPERLDGPRRRLTYPDRAAAERCRSG